MLVTYFFSQLKFSLWDQGPFSMGPFAVGVMRTRIRILCTQIGQINQLEMQSWFLGHTEYLISCHCKSEITSCFCKDKKIKKVHFYENQWTFKIIDFGKNMIQYEGFIPVDE